MVPKTGADAQALGHSRRGIRSKIHLATDAHGNPVRLILTGGQRNDITQIEALLDGLKAEYVLAPSRDICGASTLSGKGQWV
ncbi:transposase [Tropicibacter sp. R15_0]|uniref:transposase n=1 Tax=Tropicibacter sp. R15_0 TaxID=2821101 RepID=UPI00336A469F